MLIGNAYLGLEPSERGALEELSQQSDLSTQTIKNEKIQTKTATNRLVNLKEEREVAHKKLGRFYTFGESPKSNLRSANGSFVNLSKGGSFGATLEAKFLVSKLIAKVDVQVNNLNKLQQRQNQVSENLNRLHLYA